MNRIFMIATIACVAVSAQDSEPEPPPPPPAMVELFLFAQGLPPKAPLPPQSAALKSRRDWERSRSEDRVYGGGTRSLDRRQWVEAVDAFSEVAAAKGSRADGALYWKAYALGKLGRNQEALASIAELHRTHANSRWLNDSKALEAEIKQASGQPLSPATQQDEELKLMAINSLMGTDPDRVVPLLEKLLNSRSSPKLRERALFVLAQSQTPQACEIVVQFAKGKGNPDLQMKAVEYLGIHGGGNNLQVLSEIYSGSQDAQLKGRILNSYMVARDKDRLFQAARGEANPELRRSAIHLLGTMKANNELVQLYANEQVSEVKEVLINAFTISGQSDKLFEIAKSDKDPKIRRSAVQRLGQTRRSQNYAEGWVAMYGSESDKSVRRAILHSLSDQNDAPRLIEIARKETDSELKREAVQRLAHMKTKEATDYLLEILNK
ncbi:MAG: HEAT repeat domain-containing protein [Bryobacteraceae bacterium]